MLNSTLEALGFACLAVFCWLLWPPSVLVPVGLALILYANREGR